MFSKIIVKTILFLNFFQILVFAQEKQIVAYYPEWVAHDQSYYIKNILTSGAAGKITTLIFAFVTPRPDSSGNINPEFINSFRDYRQIYNSNNSIDGLADDSSQSLRGEFNQLKKLKAMYPDLKILISIGGWSGSVYFSDLALTEKSREKFAGECINEFILGNLPADSGAGGKGSAAGIFGGFDFDWEFPVSGGTEGIHHNKNDKENFSKLIAMFRKKLDAVDSSYILTATIPADKPNVDNFDIKKDQKYLNWFNLMTYDYHGGWDNVASHQTNLFSSTSDTSANGVCRSMDKSVKYLLDSLGIPSSKIIPGAAFYGRAWRVDDSVNYGLYQPGKPPSEKSGSDLVNYRSLLQLMNEGYGYHWDNKAMAPWLYSPAKKIFWSYDDPKSVALKTRYADAYNLGGLMFWEISGDDSAGTLVGTIFNGNMPDFKPETIKPGKSFPSVKIIIPGKKQNVYEHSNLIINTLSGDKGAVIKKMEFFAGDSSLGYVTIPPFNWVWFNVKRGKHKISAVATDNLGNKIKSRPVLVNVKGQKRLIVNPKNVTKTKRKKLN